MSGDAPPTKRPRLDVCEATTSVQLDRANHGNCSNVVSVCVCVYVGEGREIGGTVVIRIF